MSVVLSRSYLSVRVISWIVLLRQTGDDPVSDTKDSQILDQASASSIKK